MSSITEPLTEQQIQRRKRALIQVKHVPASDLPYRVVKRRTGVIMASFLTTDHVDAYVDSLDLEQLSRKPTRRIRR